LGENVQVIGSSRNAYTIGTGTSYASPAVSGAAALLLQAHPDWTSIALYDSLRASATSIAADSLGGYGVIDAFAASGLAEEGAVVSGFRVYNPYPQPAVLSKRSPRVYFPMDVPVGGKRVIIRIFTFSGENVKILEADIDSPGSYRDRTGAPSWDGTNFTGDTVAPGIYFYTVQMAGYSEHSGKIAVMR
ncbi:MAG: S8 family serine peptidase, partial [Candidatus Latescibacterota bacterium]